MVIPAICASLTVVFLCLSCSIEVSQSRSILGISQVTTASKLNLRSFHDLLATLAALCVVLEQEFGSENPSVSFAAIAAVFVSLPTTSLGGSFRITLLS